MEKLYKVKVLRVECHYGYDNYDYNTFLHPVSIDWEEVTAKRREEIRQAIYNANSFKKNGDLKYIMVEYGGDVMHDLFKDASAFAENVRKKQEKEEKRKADAKAVADAKAAARKRKQFEKLKAELGEA